MKSFKMTNERVKIKLRIKMCNVSTINLNLIVRFNIVDIKITSLRVVFQPILCKHMQTQEITMTISKF